MLHLRSAIFTALFFLDWIAIAIVSMPLLALPRRFTIPSLKFWGTSSTWLLTTIIGTRVEIRGREKIPPGPLLVASKHQSAFETFALVPLFADPTLVLKAELNHMPLFGWWTRKMGMVSIDRSKGMHALKQVGRDSREAFAEGRQLIIFPEGTRQAPGATPDYKVGAAYIYCNADVPCLPVALNSGLCWPRRSLLKYPGRIIVEVLDPIAPGLDRKAFNAALETAIETASDRLLAEGAADAGGAPLPETARRRLSELSGKVS